MTTRRLGVIQFPVIREGFPTRNNYYSHQGHRPTGIRCPRCCRREIVYNGNYFCSGFDDKECEWALPHGDPHPDFPRYDEPVEYWTLVDAILKSMKVRVPKWKEPENDTITSVRQRMDGTWE